MAGGPSSSSSSTFTYDVFLSFRGKDTRYVFTGSLYSALKNRGINAFLDDTELRGGEEITPSLLSAIERSRIAIVVLSENYADSSFCLNELVKIMESVHGQGRSVIPVFYEVAPTDVRHLTKTYGDYLNAHENKFKANKDKLDENTLRLGRWKMALKQVAGLSGYHHIDRNKYQYEFIGKIVEQVSRKLRRGILSNVDHSVGLDSRVQEVKSLLDLKSINNVRMVGIHGTGGIGKTTLAIEVYNSIVDDPTHSSFELMCCMEDIRENAKRRGLPYLQKFLLSKLFEENMELAGLKEGISILSSRLPGKKIFLILDDVDQEDQLNALAGEPHWFHPGSRVIITTRDVKLLSRYKDKIITYEVETLNEKGALELLSWKAFKTTEVDPSYMNLLYDVVTYASGLPLALEVIGSNLGKPNIEQWKSILDQYKEIPNEEITTKLKVSYDALKELEKKVFLDIACCFKGYELIDVKEILCAHHSANSLDNSFRLLEEKSLIKKQFGRVTFHDLIQEMGREIVCQESRERPGEHSRLWHLQDIVEVLGKNKGTDKIKMINVEFPNQIGEVVEWNRKAFGKMEYLKTLIISGGQLAKDVEDLPNSLRVLRWEKYPSASLPPDFHPEELAILKLPYGCLESLQWANALKKFVNMKVLNLDHSLHMEHIPDLSGLPNLEELSFKNCEKLIEIDESVGLLKKLRILHAYSCTKLKSFPSLKLSSLEVLNLSKCSSLEKFPEILRKMDNVTQLRLWHVDSIGEFPDSIRNLTRLRKMHVEYCGSFKFPSGILALQELDRLTIAECKGLLLPIEDEGDGKQVSSMPPSNAKHLHFRNCNMPPEFLQIVIIPQFPNAKFLFLECANLTILPECIENCHFLRKLILDDCKKLEEIGGIPPNIKCLFVIGCTSLSFATKEKLLSKKWHEEGGNKMIILPGTNIPEWFEHQSTEQTISFWFRNEFPGISLCLKHEPGQEFVNFSPTFIINGKKVYPLDEERLQVEENHIYIIDKIQGTFKDYEDGMLLENEWNKVVVHSPNIPDFNVPDDEVRLQIGLHIIKESSMDDIRFTDPLLQEEEHRSVNTGDSLSDKEFVQQQQQEANLASSESHDEGQGKESLPLSSPSTMNDNVTWGPSSKRMRTTTTVTVQDDAVKDQGRKRKAATLRVRKPKVKATSTKIGASTKVSKSSKISKSTLPSRSHSSTPSNPVSDKSTAIQQGKSPSVKGRSYDLVEVDDEEEGDSSNSPIHNKRARSELGTTINPNEAVCDAVSDKGNLSIHDYAVDDVVVPPTIEEQPTHAIVLVPDLTNSSVQVIEPQFKASSSDVLPFSTNDKGDDEDDDEFDMNFLDTLHQALSDSMTAKDTPPVSEARSIRNAAASATEMLKSPAPTSNAPPVADLPIDQLSTILNLLSRQRLKTETCRGRFLSSSGYFSRPI